MSLETAYIPAILLLFVSAVVMGIVDYCQMSSFENRKGVVYMCENIFQNFKAIAQGIIGSLVSTTLLPLEY